MYTIYIKSEELGLSKWTRLAGSNNKKVIQTIIHNLKNNTEYYVKITDDITDQFEPPRYKQTEMILE